MIKFLRQVPGVKDFTRNKQEKFFENLNFLDFKAIGEVVVREGTVADKVYLIKEGEFSIH